MTVLIPGHGGLHTCSDVLLVCKVRKKHAFSQYVAGSTPRRLYGVSVQLAYETAEKHGFVIVLSETSRIAFMTRMSDLFADLPDDVYLIIVLRG
jgi:hypothetical protein